MWFISLLEPQQPNQAGGSTSEGFLPKTAAASKQKDSPPPSFSDSVRTAVEDDRRMQWLSQNACLVAVVGNIGALIIRIGLWGQLYYKYTKDPKIVLPSIKAPIAIDRPRDQGWAALHDIGALIITYTMPQNPILIIKAPIVLT